MKLVADDWIAFFRIESDCNEDVTHYLPFNSFFLFSKFGLLFSACKCRLDILCVHLLKVEKNRKRKTKNRRKKLQKKRAKIRSENIIEFRFFS